MELEEKIEHYLQEFVDKVSEAVSEHFGEEPRQSDIWLGTYNKGVGTRISIEDKFSVDLSYSHYSEEEEEE